MSETPEKEDVPSREKDLLASLLGATVTALVRYSWNAPQEVVEEDHLAPELVFSLTAGPLLITIDSGRVVGFASQPSLISTTVWLEKESGGVGGAQEVLGDAELHPIDARDPIYTREQIRRLPGSRIVSIHIMKRAPKNALWVGLPCEVAVVLQFDTHAELILAHGLHDDSDDFSVITREQIKPSLVPQLHEIDFTEL